ncbi:MAG: hypothetical protein ACYC67_10465 [Prosthecobacter sp.]
MNLSACLNLIRPGAKWSQTNDDYALLEWLDASDKPTLAEIEAAWVQLQNAPPASVSMRGMRFALLDAGLLQPLLDAIAGTMDAAQKLYMQTWWETSPSVERAHPVVAQLAAALNQTSAQVDALFVAAKVIEGTL